MPPAVPDIAFVRYRNALALFDEFVRATVTHADAATLRGLERRFAERLQIQPSYWSQIKSRARQIGERLARQFEARCGKPVGWMDLAHGLAHGPTPAGALDTAAPPAQGAPEADRSSLGALDDDERFVVSLVLSYYRRNPQRAKARLLELLGEVLVTPAAAAADPGAGGARAVAPRVAGAPSHAVATAAPAAADPAKLWAQAQQGAVPLKKRR